MRSRSRRINLRGVVTAITYPGVGRSSALNVMLRVGEDSLVLTFLGRSDVHCIEIGTRLHVKGALVTRRGVPTVYNPSFTVIGDARGEE
ncbi:hypothetical protein VR010_12255 [Actinomycetaceae bacterium L2_0104]